MNLKFILFVACVLGAISEAKTYQKPVEPVDVPEDCASVKKKFLIVQLFLTQPVKFILGMSNKPKSPTNVR